MSRPRDIQPEPDADGQFASRFDSRLASGLARLTPASAAPPVPPAVVGLVRRRRRVRRAMHAGAGVLAVALLATLGARFATIPAGPPAPPPQVSPPDRWAHLASPDLPSALRLRDTWLQTGDLPEGQARPAILPASALLRPLDALQGGGPVG